MTEVPSYRMANKNFSCYGCGNNFRQTVNLQGENSLVVDIVNCPTCNSDFVEMVARPQAAEPTRIPRAEP